MNNSDQDYYEELGVPRDADQQTIKDAYRRLAMRWHPDRNKSPDAGERFKRIATAYAILSDPQKRAKYDARGFEGVAHYTHDDLFGGLDLGSLFGDLGFGFGPGGDSVFDRFFHPKRPRPNRGEDIHINAEIPLETIQQGDSHTVSFSQRQVCAHCSGQGTADGKPAPVCPACGGSGHKVVHSQKQRAGSEIHLQQIVTCPECLGRGTSTTQPCPVCTGTGQTSAPKTLRLHIPKGIEDGMTLRVPGQGIPGPTPEIEAGDLLISVFSLPDGRFQRRGADLWRSETLSPDEAALGTRRVVPTLDGDVEVKIPPGSQPDEILRLRGKGLPRYSARGNGNLNIRLQVQIPTTLTDRERLLYQQLRKERTGQRG